MKRWMVAGLGLLMMGGAGVAVAQQAQQPLNPPLPPGGPAAAQAPGGGPEGMRGPRGPGPGPMAEGPEGGWGWRGRHDRGHMPPPPTKAAFFRLKKGDASITVKCAENEPMKACVDAANLLLDKAAAQK